MTKHKISSKIFLERLANFELKIGYTFKDRNLIMKALTQAGISSKSNNENLEFLGDRVLGLCVAEYLYHKFYLEKEGVLAIHLGILTSKEVILKVAEDIKIQDILVYARTTTDDKSSILSDGVEAVLGAIWLEAGTETAFKIIQKLYEKYWDIYQYTKRDPKTLLQEWLLARHLELPVYDCVEQAGQKHNPIFKMEVTSGDKTVSAVGNSKKKAEKNAAEKLLKVLESAV
ncbi:MAG: ribonuclease III [Alphaproteobacteria bacterium]|nr:ribonuclease III [Alphaproteobacteria bacterium]MBL0718219.1 ribonuclease III [Alphaproteobacteria bacterium]